MIVYAQYSSIGEMMAYKPVHGGFIRTCIEYVDPAFGFAVGINFWFAVSEYCKNAIQHRRNAELTIASG